MSKQDPNLISPLGEEDSSATKSLVIEGLKQKPEFSRLKDQHWDAIYAEWSQAKEGRPATAEEVGTIVGVSGQTIRNWRRREDFLKASDQMSMVVLHEWKPTLVNRALKLAASGDRKMLEFFLERIYPKDPKGGGDDSNALVNVQIDWSNTEAPPIVDAEAEICPKN